MSRETSSPQREAQERTRRSQEEESPPPFDFSQKPKQSWFSFRQPQKNLGKRVFQEMAGNQSFRLNPGGELEPWRDTSATLPERATVARTAKLLGLTPYAVRRITKAFYKGGEGEVQQLRWGKGRPVKNLNFDQYQIDIMVSRYTLNQQVGMSLKARALAFKQRWGKPINAYQLRCIYKGRGITLQLPKTRLGPPNLGTTQEQLERIEQLQVDLKQAIEEDRELICIDECVFSSRGAKRYQWAPKGRPLEWDRRFYPDKYVAVCAATSTLRGLIFYKSLHGQAFTKMTFMAFMRSLHDRCRDKHRPIAILLDNCRIHESEKFYQYCDKHDIQVIWNVKYRPDFNGIEYFWAIAKRDYRARIDNYKANGLQWNEMQLVQDVLETVDQAQAVKCTQRGFENIKRGEPVFAKRFDQGPKHDLRLGDLRKILKSSAQNKVENQRSQGITQEQPNGNEEERVPEDKEEESLDSIEEEIAEIEAEQSESEEGKE